MVRPRFAVAALLVSALPLTAFADVTGFTGGSQPQPTLQPSVGITYMIRDEGIFNDIGEIGMFAGNFVPAGWLPCDGSLRSIAQDNALFAQIGTTYGGDGQIT